MVLCSCRARKQTFDRGRQRGVRPLQFESDVAQPRTRNAYPAGNAAGLELFAARQPASQAASQAATDSIVQTGPSIEQGPMGALHERHRIRTGNDTPTDMAGKHSPPATQ